MAEEEVGVVDHWFGHISVAGIKVTKGSVKIGDTLHFKGHTTDFQETVQSMQVENASVEVAKKGDVIGMKVKDKVRIHDHVFKVTAE